MDRIYAIALNAYREAIRDRVLYGVIGLAVASLLFGATLAWIAVSDQVRVVIDWGLATISLLSNLVAIFLGASFLYKEIELRTLYIILAKPVMRWEFIVGKFLGIVFTGLVFVTVTASVLLLLLDVQAAELTATPVGTFAWLSRHFGGSRVFRFSTVTLALATFLAVVGLSLRVPAVARIHRRLGGAVSILIALAVFALSAAFSHTIVPSETMYVIRASMLITGEVALTAAIALLFSSFSTPFVTAMFTLGVFIIGRSAHFIEFIRTRALPAEILAMLRHVAEVVPNLDLFVPVRTSLVPTDDPSSAWPFVARVLAYGATYATVLLVLAATFFRKRDLT